MIHIITIYISLTINSPVYSTAGIRYQSVTLLMNLIGLTSAIFEIDLKFVDLKFNSKRQSQTHIQTPN